MTASARGLLDTSTVILLGRITDSSSLPPEPVISAVTLAELSVGPQVASTPSVRADRQAHLQQAEADFEPLPFDAGAARAFGLVAASLREAGRKPAARAYDVLIAASLREAGRKPAARAYDVLIAATAIANDLPLFTCNPADFTGIERLDLRAVPHPDR